MIAIRGAITVDQNSRTDILERTRQLLDQIIEQNKLKPEQIISIHFSGTPDLTKVYPAVAAREMGLVNAALFCTQEMAVDGALKMCVRVLMYVQTDKLQNQAQHCYLEKAAGLRPDLIKL